MLVSERARAIVVSCDSLTSKENRVAASYDKQKLFSEHWLFRCLSEAEVDRLIQFSRIQHYPSKKELCHQGDKADNMMVVLNGRVKISNCSADGKEITFSIVGPGGIIGEMALLTRDNRSASVMTLESCDVLAIERRDFMYSLERNPKLCIELLDVLCQRLQKTNQQVEDTVFLDRPAKAAKALLWLAKEYGEETSEGTRIDLKLSQRELGNLIGLTRESVNKQMVEWREQGIVRLVDGFITLQDLNLLEEISEPS